MEENRQFTGIVSGQIIEARFPFSGLVEKILKHPGDKTAKGEILAVLSKKELQSVLDKELADYERVRAEFELYVMDHPEVANDRQKYEKIQVQATLNAAVKAVEQAKFRLDGCELRSPTAGIITSDGGLRTSMFATPSSNAFEIWEEDSAVFEIEANWKDLTTLVPGNNVRINRDNSTLEIKGVVLPIIPSIKGKLIIRIRPENCEGLLPGMNGLIYL